MNIAWLTPLARSSAIGRFSALVCDALLDAGHDCTIIRTERIEDQDETHHVTRCPVRAHQDLDPSRVCEDHDAVIVNIGDNYAFHAGIVPFLETGLTIGIFHDAYLFNLFNGHAAAAGLSEDQKFAEVAATYAGYTRKRWDADHASDLAPWEGIARIAAATPMTEWFAAKCIGAVAHSDFYRDRLDAACPGPSAVLPLAWTGTADEIETVPERCERAQEEPLRLVTFGVLNANKCADRIIEALGSDPDLAATIDYRLVGAISDEERARLTALAEDKNVRVTMLGRVTDEALASELSCADIVSCLRAPVLEGASASAIEAMLAGCPTLVCDAGFYAGLPDDCVAKVDPRAQPSDIAPVLKKLADSVDIRHALADRAYAYARQTFAAEPYAAAIAALAADAVAALPYLGLCDRVGGLLGQIGIAEDSTILASVTRTITAMDARHRDPSGQSRGMS